MSTEAIKNDSYWKNSALPAHQKLQADTHTDVCIVGGGIAGLTTAYLLAREGEQVVVLEGHDIADGETGRTTAHLSNALDDRFYQLERMHGEPGARLAAASHTAAIERIETIVQEESIDCDFERLDGYLFLAPEDHPETLQKEFDAARRAGLAVEFLRQVPWNLGDGGPCLRFPGQGQFHPRKYLRGLVMAIEKLGGRIFTHTHVKSVTDGEPCRVETSEGHMVIADAVMVATNSPINDLIAIHTKQAGYTTYVVAGRVTEDVIPRALYWDTGDPYHYVRLQRFDEHTSEPLLIIGGEDHRAGEATDQAQIFERLETWARERFPFLGPIEYRWCGQVQEPADGMAFIGRNPGERNVYISTGDSGHGMTHGTIAGMLVTDLILNRANAWETIYDPARKMTAAPGEYLFENLDTARHYLEWITPGEVSSADEIEPGQGALVRSGLTKNAVYKDDAGQVHECSAVCTHLGCFVHWNGAAKTWDCPCHGSRFDSYGRVLEGPANTDLEVHSSTSSELPTPR